MLALIEQFRGLEQKVRDSSNAKADLFSKRGQLLPRERLALLLDRGAPWLELSTLCGFGMHDDTDQPSGGGIAVRESSNAFIGGNQTMFDTSLGWRFPNPAMARLFPLEAMGETAENLATRYNIGRAEQDELALRSHELAVRATICDGKPTYEAD